MDTPNAVFVQRLHQAVRVMRGLPDMPHTEFDINVIAVRLDGTLKACVAGLCGLDPWFQAEGLSTTIGDGTSADTGDLSVFPRVFFGTDRPFYRHYYGAAAQARGIGANDAIAALEREITRLASLDAPSSQSSSTPKFPHVHVQLTGADGNVFAIIGGVERALKEAGATEDQVKAFCKEMEAGDYDDALRTVMRWVRVS